MKSGKILRRFTVKDGREIILRIPRWEDLDGLMELMNSLVEEDADIHRTEKMTREQAADWLGRKMADIEKGDLFFLMAEVNRRTIAHSELRIGKGRSAHVGDIGLVIMKGYRDIGIGTEILISLISQAEEKGLKMMTLTGFSTNRRAIHLYEKLGFKETGRIPNNLYKNGKFIDEIIMVKELSQEALL